MPDRRNANVQYHASRGEEPQKVRRKKHDGCHSQKPKTSQLLHPSLLRLVLCCPPGRLHIAAAIFEPHLVRVLICSPGRGVRSVAAGAVAIAVARVFLRGLSREVEISRKPPCCRGRPPLKAKPPPPEAPASAETSATLAHHAEEDLRIDAAHASSASEHVRHVRQVIAAVIAGSFPIVDVSILSIPSTNLHRRAPTYCGSLSVSYASLMSLKRASASVSPGFLSGWWMMASFR